MSKIIETSLIGETIKQLRLSRHWTQEDLADRTFYSVRNIRRIENEGTKSIDVVNTFAELFGVSALDILNGVSFLRHKLLFVFRTEKGMKVCPSFYWCVKRMRNSDILFTRV